MKRILFAPDADAGAGSPAPAAPPAAAAVANGPHTELENDLRRQLAEAKAAQQQTSETSAAEKRKLETRVSELEDELNRVKQAQQAQKAPWKYRPFKSTPPAANA
jgi:hypothetical protein